MMQPDPFQKAHADATAAVATFLPSLVTPPPAPQPPPPAIVPRLMEPVRALSMARHVEGMAARVARGLPAIAPPPPTPQETFPGELDPVHIRALTSAIEAHPEDQRAALIHEAHQNISKWIAAHNGQIVVDSKMEIAHNPQSAETLAAKIINEAVDAHDARKVAEQEAAADTDEQERPHSPKKTETPAQPSPASQGAQPAPSTSTPNLSASASPVVSQSAPSPDATIPELPTLDQRGVELPDEDQTSGKVQSSEPAQQTGSGGSTSGQQGAGIDEAAAVDDSGHDGAAGAVLPESSGPTADTDMASKGPRQIPQKGDAVTLKDGSQGTLKYLHPTLNKARVTVDGKTLEVKKSDLQVAS